MRFKAIIKTRQRIQVKERQSQGAREPGGEDVRVVAKCFCATISLGKLLAIKQNFYHIFASQRVYSTRNKLFHM